MLAATAEPLVLHVAATALPVAAKHIHTRLLVAGKATASHLAIDRRPSNSTPSNSLAWHSILILSQKAICATGVRRGLLST